MVKGNSMIGITLVSIILKKLHNNVRTKNQKLTPKQNVNVFFNPCLFANVIAMILLGPGVKLLIKTNNKNENKGIFSLLLFMGVCYNVQNEQYNVLLFIIHNGRYNVYSIGVILWRKFSLFLQRI